MHATAPSENHGHEGQALPLTPQEGEAFKEAFPAVMVDTSLGFNVLGMPFFSTALGGNGSVGLPVNSRTCTSPWKLIVGYVFLLENTPR